MMLTCALWPEFKVRGKEVPERVNWELLLEAEDTVTVPPLAVIVEGCEPVLPILMLPKLRVDGVTLSWPAVVVEPVPDIGTLRLGPGTKTLPLSKPVVDGVKVTLSVTLCPLLSVIGSEGPLTPKLLPTTWNAVRVSLDEPELVRIRESEELLPTLTCPKERLDGAGVNVLPLIPMPRSPS